ncbi:MAG: peptidase U32 family protein, partial [Bacteroidaceae bacterium]
MTTLNTQSIELLAPARNYDCAIEAIRQGADAIYIGSSRFGARAAAGNSTEDIARLVEYAHLYRVKIYVTLNTILYDDELEEAKALAWELYRIGVDALIIQDMALLQLELPPIALHASTQMNNCTASKVKQLAAEGFSQVVLAR